MYVPEPRTHQAITGSELCKIIELLNIYFNYEAALVVKEAYASELAANECGEIKIKVTMDGDKHAKIKAKNKNETHDFFNKASAAGQYRHCQLHRGQRDL